MSEDDDKKDSWPWNDKMFQSLQAEHERFMRELREGDKESPREDGRSSPFSMFKRFIDDSVNGISEGFKKFPSNIQEIKAKMQREQERRLEEERDISRRWTGSDDSPDHIQMELSRSTQDDRGHAHSSMRLLLLEALNRNADVPAEKIERLFEDKESMLGDLDRLVNPLLALGGAWFYLPETGDKLPTAEERSLRWFGPIPRWLSVDWFKRSPYSPIRLEAHPDLGQSGAKWRAAFEDLMDATLGKPMSSMERVGVREPHGRPQSTYYGPGLEWMLSLQCRGILPPLLPRFYNDIHGKQALRQFSMLDSLATSKADLPWSLDRSLAWYSPLNRDFSDLLSEIATKATSATEAEPMPVQSETELDLYESPYVFPPKHVSAESGSTPSINGLSLSGDYIVDLDEAEYALWEALDKRDAKTAASVLNEWYRKYRDVGELVDEPLSEFAENPSFFSDDHEWHSVLLEALHQSKLPDSDRFKQLAIDPDSVSLRKLNTISREEELLQNQLRRQGNQLAGKELAWPPCTTEELQRKVERMEEEHENVQIMTGGKKSNAPAAIKKEDLSKKPDVLSALTTTHTTRLPDGTVTTKVVLKKRFADGREETTESVHTTNERLEQQGQGEKEEPKKKGWFWS